MYHEYHDTIFKNSHQKDSEEVHATQRGTNANTKMGSKLVPGRYCGGFGTGDTWRGSNV